MGQGPGGDGTGLDGFAEVGLRRWTEDATLSAQGGEREELDHLCSKRCIVGLKRSRDVAPREESVEDGNEVKNRR